MTVRLLLGDCREVLRGLPDGSVNCIVTSPPYFGLRDYGTAAQIGREPDPATYVSELVSVFREARRVLRDDGTLWLNLGDSYAHDTKWGGSSGGKHVAELHGADGPGRGKRTTGLKSKDLIGIPWRVAFALQADGWWLRQDIIWAKPNAMPGSQKDRPTSSHESIFLLTKAETYWTDFDAIKTPPHESSKIRLAEDIQSQAGSSRAYGSTKVMKAVTGKQRGHDRVHTGFNDRWDHTEKVQQQAAPAMMRDVWFVASGGYAEAHFAVMPVEIARRCILAGCPEGGVVLDPFGGAGTVSLVAERHARNSILIELSPNYVAMAQKRLRAEHGLLLDLRDI